MVKNNRNDDLKDAVPVETEADFKFEEIFVSRTDKKGIIQFGNEVFVRVSEYEEAHLIDSPHNIIRHQDMPKSIFKLFWDTLKSDKTIVAYVKNKSKTGKYYWVLSTAFPIENGYLSIRVKPATEIFKVIPNLYSSLKFEEEHKGIEAAQKLLESSLKGLNFSGYEQFMYSALIQEIFTRKSQAPNITSIAKNVTASYEGRIFLDWFENIVNTFENFEKTVDSLKKFADANTEIQKNVNTLLASDTGLDYLAVNMSISAYRMGKEGGTLSVVAQEFQKAVRNVSTSFNDFSTRAKEISENLEKTIFYICYSKVQIEMLMQLFFESLNAISRKDDITRNKAEAFQILKSLVMSFKTQKDSLSNFTEILISGLKELRGLQKSITKLDLIKAGGQLESARSSETEEAFKIFIENMESFIKVSEEPTSKLLVTLEGLGIVFPKILAGLVNVEYNLNQLEKNMVSELETNQVA